MSTSSRLLEEKVTLPSSGQTIHYNISGSGGHPVLLLPGALGTAKTDFPPQIDPEEGLVAAAPNVLKVVGWDPPGMYEINLTDTRLAAESPLAQLNSSSLLWNASDSEVTQTDFVYNILQLPRSSIQQSPH